MPYGWKTGVYGLRTSRMLCNLSTGNSIGMQKKIVRILIQVLKSCTCGTLIFIIFSLLCEWNKFIHLFFRS